MATLRRATPDDAPELTRLRALMYVAMGTDPGPDDHPWRTRCEADLRRRLGGDGFVAFVVEDDGVVVASGAGWLEEHLPGPTQPDGRRGHIASMSTDPDHRRRGHARAVFAALMMWFGEQGIPRVDLRATDDGRPLYEDFGFRVLGGATMAWTVPGVTPGMPGA